MDVSEIVGLAAAALTTLCMLPQVIKSYKTKSTRDLSWGYLLMLGVALILWTAYGIMIGSTPILLGNMVSETLVLSLAFLKFRHG